MPNWCDNHLDIHGDEDTLDSIEKKIRHVPLKWSDGHEERVRRDIKELRKKRRSTVNVVDLIRITHTINRLKEILKRDTSCEEEEERVDLFASFFPPPPEILKQGYSMAGYNWQLENWGTKWDACALYTNRHDPVLLTLDFSTAWSPPIPWVIQMSELYPTLIFELYYFEPGLCFAGRVKASGGCEDIYHLSDKEVECFVREHFNEEFVYYNEEEEDVYESA